MRKSSKNLSSSFNLLNKEGNERNNRKQNTCFRFRLEDHYIEDFPKLENSEKKVCWNTDKPKTSAYKSEKVDQT